MTLVVAVGVAAIMTAAAVSTSTFSAYADKPKKCDSSDEPPFKNFPGESGPTGNPHTCEQPTGDPHDDPDNPSEGNPHNTDNG
jgi:hypothetical protein